MSTRQERSGQYALTETETVVVGRVAYNMRAVGLLMVVYGVGFLLIGSVTVASTPAEGEGWSELLQSCLFLLLGVWTRQAGTSFWRITSPQGKDTGLVVALDKLHRLYRLQKWLLILGIMLFIAVFLGTFFHLFVMPKLLHYFAR